MTNQNIADLHTIEIKSPHIETTDEKTHCLYRDYFFEQTTVFDKYYNAKTKEYIIKLGEINELVKELKSYDFSAIPFEYYTGETTGSNEPGSCEELEHVYELEYINIDSEMREILREILKYHEEGSEELAVIESY